LNLLKSEGATHILIDSYYNEDYPDTVIKAVNRRLETDTEFEQRKKDIEKRLADSKDYELELLAKLKAKYE
jgi:hypothetical protein